MDAKLLKSFAGIVGDRHVFAADDERAAAAREMFGLLIDRQPEFVGVVRPENVESLQAVMRLAHARGLSPWWVANAAGNGATLGEPGTPGLIIDLRRMDRILEVDATSACALVEPGVSYRQLHEHLRAKKIPLRVDADWEFDNSIAGSICSRQFGPTPYGDRLLMQCGMEVVLCGGEIMRTGMGALPGSRTWQLFKYNFGPYVDGLFTQSGFGVVSKVGLWLMPDVPAYVPFRVALPGPDQLRDVIEVMRGLRINGVIPNTVVIPSAELDAAPYGRRADFPDAERIDGGKAGALRNGGRWNLYAALYGSAENVDVLRELVFGQLGAVPGVQIASAEDGKDDPIWRDRQLLMAGEPPRQSFNLAGWGGPSCMRLTVAGPMEGERALELAELISGVLTTHGLDYLAEFLLGARAMLKQIYIPYATGDAAAIAHCVDAIRALLPALTGAGYGIVGESVELRTLVDRHVGATPLAGLVERLRQGLLQTT